MNEHVHPIFKGLLDQVAPPNPTCDAPAPWRWQSHDGATWGSVYDAQGTLIADVWGDAGPWIVWMRNRIHEAALDLSEVRHVERLGGD